MVYHVLNGDALLDRFSATGLNGEAVIMRECLIEGDVTGDTLPEFYRTRAAYLQATYPTVQESYYTKVVPQLEKLTSAPADAEFNLWFGYDLFCQVNLWFILSLLHKQSHKEVFVVYPTYLSGTDVWQDFGLASAQDLLNCFQDRVKLNQEDLALGKDLWEAYKNGDPSRLEELSKRQSACFPYLREVCAAHLERFPGNGEKGRPEKAIEEIVQSAGPEFAAAFDAFSRKEGIYGFGDAQLRQIYDRVVSTGTST
ncbi:hypothetical protein [Sabulibacter ruber]|uniref:hypothetical protein n=1 Tax=Sabulibacter ruber TaxID=2811901 RepID=UPI001A957929|nr:hypothetical protein [Sabulibacter ruber]